MNPLLMLGGLAVAKKSIHEAVRRTARGVAAYAVLAVFLFTALGFLTAACFLYIMSIWGAVAASMVLAVAYAILGLVGFLTIRVQNKAPPSREALPLSTAVDQLTTAAASRDMPGGVIAVGLFAAAGYLMGRSMARRR